MFKNILTRMSVEKRKKHNYRLAARRFPALEVSFLDFLPAAGLPKIILGTIPPRDDIGTWLIGGAKFPIIPGLLNYRLCGNHLQGYIYIFKL